MSDRTDKLAALAGAFACGVLAVFGVEMVVAVKALARSGGALKTWADLRGLRKATPQGKAGAN